MPGVPKTAYENLSIFFVILKTIPISVKSFVKNIKGRSPGKTENTKSFSPEIVPSVKIVGFEMIIIITKSIKIVSKLSWKKLELKHFKKVLLELIVFVGFIIKYMIK